MLTDQYNFLLDIKFMHQVHRMHRNHVDELDKPIHSWNKHTIQNNTMQQNTWSASLPAQLSILYRLWCLLSAVGLPSNVDSYTATHDLITIRTPKENGKNHHL